MKFLTSFLALAVLGALSTGNIALAQVAPGAPVAPKLTLLHPLFSDNAILQRDQPVSIWGWAQPGSRVTVHIANQDVAAMADASGRWLARIGPFPAGGSLELTVNGAGPNDTVTRKNIIFGDVWLCSGQSNMELPVNRADNAATEKAAANFPQMRVFRMSRIVNLAPQLVSRGTWKSVTPESIGDFSAVAYFFGRKLHQELGVPIGLIDSTWGGTPAEAWISEEALGTLPDFRQPLEKWQGAVKNPMPYNQQIAQWWAKNDQGVQQGWQTADAAETKRQACQESGRRQDCQDLMALSGIGAKLMCPTTGPVMI